MLKEVVRVAASNNFNCTAKEWVQLIQLAELNPDSFFFVNSNIKTPRLDSIREYTLGNLGKAVVTVNPDLTIEDRWVDRAIKLKAYLAFVRVKWLPRVEPIRLAINQLIMAGLNVVVTLQRFNGKKSIANYTFPCYYKFEYSRFRLQGIALREAKAFVDHYKKAGYGAYICDRKGLGCRDCGLCSLLVTGQKLPVKSVNLSSSGICPYNCPDCYAKTMQHFSVAMGHNPIAYDKIAANDKQAGRLVHIKEKKRGSKI